MNCRIELKEWNKIFAVPSSVVDKHLSNVDLSDLKVLLWVLRRGGESCSVNDISNGLGINSDDIKKSLNYWKACSIMNFDINEEPPEEQQLPQICAPVASQPVTPLIRYPRPGSFYVADRMEKSSEIKAMMQEAQIILGRPLSNGDSAVLIMLHDNDGLPADVIIMLLQYSASIGKRNLKYIEKVGISWAKEGIDTLEKAEKKIQSLNESLLIWNKFRSIIGIDNRAPTAREEETVVKWVKEWNLNDDLLKEAYDRCVDSNGKYVLKYMDSIIKRWHTQGVFTIEQARMETINRKKSRKKSDFSENNASYSIEEYENYSIFDKAMN